MCSLKSDKMDAKQLLVLGKWLQCVQKELTQVTGFWVKYSHDDKNGGFFTCLTEDGKVYDTTKYMWLQARQVWMYLTLHRDVPRLRKYNIKEPAIKGAHFLFNCLIEKNSFKRCPFSVTIDGKPTKVQRGLFSECFYVLAMAEAWRATSIDKFKDSAVQMMRNIKHWCMTDDSALGRDVLSGCEPVSSLAVPMMALCVCEQMETCGIAWEAEIGSTSKLEDWAVTNLMLHVKRGGSAILENVTPNGGEMHGATGRLHIPGHAIECGWFLLQYAIKKNDGKLAEQACKLFIEGPFQRGWDMKNGGLFYFLDVDGYCPVQLEWNMKLWWPHCEAMVAHLLAFKHSRDPIVLEKFTEIAEYTFSKFPDKRNGGWYGYLHSSGDVSSSFKGGPWKGFFHVPRALYLCEILLKQLLSS